MTTRVEIAGACASVAAFLSSLLLGLAAHAQAQTPPPRAHADIVTETLHGVRIEDPYRHLEDLKSEDTQGWARIQAAHARAMLDRVQGRDELGRRVAALTDASGDEVRSVLRMPGERLYYLKRRAGENQFKLVRRIGIDGQERVILDPESKLAGGAIAYFRPSWDGRWLAFGVTKGGSEDASLEVMEIDSSRRVGSPIPRVTWSKLHWTADSRRLSYTQRRALPPDAPETEMHLDATVSLLTLGSGKAAPTSRPIFGSANNPALRLDRLDFGEVIFAPDSPFMVARTTDTTVPEGKLFVAPVAALEGKGAIPWRAIATAKDKIVEVHLRGNQLYLRTLARSPKGEVMALDLRNPMLARATRIVAAPAQGAIDGFVVGDDHVLAQVREPFRQRLWRHPIGSGSREVSRNVSGKNSRKNSRNDGRKDSRTSLGKAVELTPGKDGSFALVAEPMRGNGDSAVLAMLSSWTQPARFVALDAKGAVRETTLMRRAPIAGAPELEAVEVLVPSHDGARVPMAIVHRKGLPLDTMRPTILVGYGAYGLSIGAHFDPRALAWLEQGGVLAFANVRGSGAYGETWHRAGFKATKPNTWKDGIACARWLIERHYTSPKTLAISGRSAGGIFVGRAVTTTPELFAAAIFDVALLDTVRAEHTANGITNISEFGSVKDPKEFAALLEMSPYHHIRKGVKYPAALMIHGMNDPRVEAWHTLKTGARLMAADSDGPPMLLRLDTNDGHGMGRSASQRNEQLADVYGFLLWRFGLRGLTPARAER